MSYYHQKPPEGMRNGTLEELVGKRVSSVSGMEEDSEECIIGFSDGSQLVNRYYQDCCAHTRILDVVGDPSDLVGQPLLMAELVSNADAEDLPDPYDSHTWTFVKYASPKGYVTVRWLGESNGYYSEEPDVEVFVPFGHLE